MEREIQLRENDDVIYDIPVFNSIKNEDEHESEMKSEGEPPSLVNNVDEIDGDGIIVSYNQGSESTANPELRVIHHHGEDTDHYRFCITDPERNACSYTADSIDSYPSEVLNAVLASGFYIEECDADSLHHYTTTAEEIDIRMSEMNDRSVFKIPFLQDELEEIKNSIKMYVCFLKAMDCYRNDYQDIVNELEKEYPMYKAARKLNDMAHDDVERSIWAAEGDDDVVVEEICINHVENGDILLTRLSPGDIYPYIYLKHQHDTNYVCQKPDVDFLAPHTIQHLSEYGIHVDNVEPIKEDMTVKELLEILYQCISQAPEVVYDGFSLTESLKEDINAAFGGLVLFEIAPEEFARTALKVGGLINRNESYPQIEDLTPDDQTHLMGKEMVVDNLPDETFEKLDNEFDFNPSKSRYNDLSTSDNPLSIESHIN